MVWPRQPTIALLVENMLENLGNASMVLKGQGIQLLPFELQHSALILIFLCQRTKHCCNINTTNIPPLPDKPCLDSGSLATCTGLQMYMQATVKSLSAEPQQCRSQGRTQIHIFICNVLNYHWGGAGRGTGEQVAN